VVRNNIPIQSFDTVGWMTGWASRLWNRF